MTFDEHTSLAELARRNEAATRGVLERFAIIHCEGCAVPEGSVEQVAKQHKLPVDVVLNALRAEVK